VTAFAVYLARERCVVAGDTAVFLPGKPPRLVGYTSKVYPLAHVRAAVFGRGQQRIITGAAGLVALCPRLDTIEKVAEGLPDLLRLATQHYCREIGLAGDPAGFGLVEAYLAGWSVAQRRMRLWQFQNIEDFAPRDDEAGRHYGLLALPRLPDEDMPPRGGSLDAQLAEVMQAEQLFFEAHPEWGVLVGGEVQAWNLTRDELRQRVIHRFPDYGRPHDGADLLKRIMTGEEPYSVAEHLVPAAEMRRLAPAGEAV
jgi:hypothetical protein